MLTTKVCAEAGPRTVSFGECFEYVCVLGSQIHLDLSLSILLAPFMQFDFDSAAPPEQAWRRRLNSHANILKEFSVTFMEAIKMASCF